MLQVSRRPDFLCVLSIWIDASQSCSHTMPVRRTARQIPIMTNVKRTAPGFAIASSSPFCEAILGACVLRDTLPTAVVWKAMAARSGSCPQERNATEMSQARGGADVEFIRQHHCARYVLACTSPLFVQPKHGSDYKAKGARHRWSAPGHGVFRLPATPRGHTKEDRPLVIRHSYTESTRMSLI